MKKHVYLGVQEGRDRACILKSLADFDTLSLHASTIEPTDFVHDATNWGGCDTVKRTCDVSGLTPTGRRLQLSHPIVFNGSDYDTGNQYSWAFQVDTICEVK